MKIYINLGRQRYHNTRVEVDFIKKFTFRKKRVYFTYQEIWLNNLGQEYVKYTSSRTRRWDYHEYEVGERNGFGHKLLELNKCYLIN